jgi:hypothetical protein
VQQERDRIDAEKQASFARLQAWAEGRYRARLAAVPPAPKSSGTGWSILTSPRQPHAVLESACRALWGVLRGEPWPSGMRVYWAALDDAQGMFVPAPEGAPYILVDQSRYLDGTRTRKELERTLWHECSHFLNPPGGHGAASQRTLEHGLALLALLEEAPAPAPTVSRPPQFNPDSPMTTKGRRFGGRPAPAWAAGTDWEFRG